MDVWCIGLKGNGMVSALKSSNRQKFQFSAVFSLLSVAVMAVSVGYNIGFGQKLEQGAANSRIVNVHADRLKPLLDALSNESAPVGRKTTNLHVEPSEPTTLTQKSSGESGATFDISQLQQDLMLQGAYNGPLTNQLDQATRLAIRRYQGERGLLVTGELSPELQDALAFDRKIDSAVGYTASVSPAYRREKVQEVQNELLRLGYEPGPADGALGLNTTAAIKQFQRNSSMEPTGLLSKALLSALGIL